MFTRHARLLLFAVLAAAVLVAIFSVAVIRYRRPLRAEIRQAIIDRDATVLRPVALRELADREASGANETDSLVGAVLASARQEGMLAVAVYDGSGRSLGYAPESLLFPELPWADYVRLLKGETISAYHPDFVLSRYFAGLGAETPARTAPVLEVLIPLPGKDGGPVLGFAQYFLDARGLAAELAALDRRVDGETAMTLGVGIALILVVVGASTLALARAQAALEQRNAQLVRANFDLTLAAKTSAIGQLTAHLIHGLQGSVAGLQAVVANRSPDQTTPEAWDTAADYTERMQTMIQETVALLTDASTGAMYQLSGYEMAELVRARGSMEARKKGVEFSVQGGFDETLESHRGGLLCLIAQNLVQNAIEATAAGDGVEVSFRREGGDVLVRVTDSGPGIPENLRAHLFEPGRSGRPGGTGLGLAISRLLAQQIGATLALETTGPDGTAFLIRLQECAEGGSTQGITTY